MSGAKRTGPAGRKGHRLAGDLIALGSKPGAPKTTLRHEQLEDTKKSGGSSVSGGPPVKKHKAAPSSGENSGGLFSNPILVSQVSSSTPSSLAKSGAGGASKAMSQQTSSSGSPGASIIEVRSGELLPAVREALSAGNDSKAAKLVAGGLKQLKQSRLKPDKELNIALTALIKESPQLFSVPSSLDGLIAVLKREPSAIYKAKSNPSVYILAAKLLLLALKDSYDWPETVAKVYMEDSLGDRIWVDLDACKKLVDNVCTLFQTKPYLPGGSSGPNSGPGIGTGTGTGASMSSGADSTSPSQSSSSEGGEAGGGGGGDGKPNEELTLADVEVTLRFSPASIKSLKTNMMQLVNEQLGRHSLPADNVPRNLLKFLTSAVGLPEVRLFVAQKIESWIQNPKLTKQCQDLLMTVAVNSHTHSAEDIKVIESLINIRFKTKLFSNQFVACIKELISSHPANLGTVLTCVVNNELGQCRSHSNMALISMMLYTWPDETAKLLGGIFQDFLTRKEDYLRALRGFLREIVRVMKNDFSFTMFTRSLMQERSEPSFTQAEQQHKERMALSIADLIACASMLTANMLIREAYNGYTKGGEKAMVEQLQEFFSTLGLIQRDAVWWVHTIVPTMFRPQPVDYKTCLRKVLFLEPSEAYTSKDNWPPESDRSLILHMMGEACLKEDTLMRVLVIGLARELPLSSTDAMDIADVLVARAANAHTEEIARLPAIERKELFNVIFNITTYRPPPNIQLPEGYQPPTLTISKLYWKGWILLLVLSAYNPKTIGLMGWKEYPMLCSMMEMVMTNTYTFPMSMSLDTSEDGSKESKDVVILRDVQISHSEKEAILEYENHLASSSSQNANITEANSFLLNQLTLLQPKGPARRIPSSAIELIRSVNRTLKLGQLLCRCRSPDFLLDVIKKQGTLESMKWLSELVESSHSSLEVLPVPCLCEFLMASYQDQMSGGHATGDGDADLSSHRAHYKRKKTVKDKAHERHRQLVKQLQALLSGPQSSPDSCTEVLSYFLEKLTLSQLTPRGLALKALNEILGTKPGGGGGGGVHSSRSRKGSQSDDADEDDCGSLSKLTNEDWLLSSLPNLPHFAVVLPRIYRLLLQASVMETNLNCLQSLFHFLTHYPPEEKIYESAIILSSVIIDRFDSVRKLLSIQKQSPPPPPTNLGPHSQAAVVVDGMFILGSLLSMLKKAMEMAINSQTMPQLSSSEEFLLVSFPTIGKKTIIHTSLIQAIMLLLSFDLRPGADSSDYRYFLDQWFPGQEENRPEAHAVESKEKASFPHPSILPYMLLSSNPRVLSASIASSSPSQLCSFVKQFGSPLVAMEKVLESLDGLCEDHDSSTELRRCVHDAVDMCRFVEVHILRGTASGKTFLSFLQGLANVAPTEPVTSIASVFESEKPSSSSLMSFAGHFPSSSLLTSSSSTLPSARSGSGQSSSSYAKLMNSSQDEVERMLQQCFSTPSAQSKKASTSGKAQQVASDLVLALRHCASSSGGACVAGTTVVGVGVGGASSVGGASGALSESFVNSCIGALHKLLSSSKTKKSVLDGMVQSRHAISLLRMVTKLSQLLSKNGGSLRFSLFQTTLQLILQALDSYTFSSELTTKFAAFNAAVKSCAKQLGVEHKPSSTSTTHVHASASAANKLEPAVIKACKEVGESKDPFRNKTSLVKLCQSLIQASRPALFEQLLSSVVKRSISLGKEQQCNQFLYAVKTSAADSALPVVLKFYPSYFTVRGEGDGEASRSQSPEDELMETTNTVAEKLSPYWKSGSGVHIDICGLLVDWLELLDPEVLSLSPKHSMKMVFGCSNTEQLSTILSSIQRKEMSEQFLPKPPRISPSLLLSGQGYLQDILTNSSSWPTLVGTIKALLSSDSINEWINPSAVLDFLWACLHKPCLWQERVKKEAVVNSYLSLGIDEESRLNLSPPQLECLVFYILKEAACCVAGAKGLTSLSVSGDQGESSEIPAEAQALLHSRLPLLMCCCHDNQKSLNVIVKLLETHSSYPSLSWQLLVNLYHANERVILAVDHTRRLSVSSLNTSTPSKLDTELHYLLTAMAGSGPTDSHQDKMTSAALLCRKVTIRHPALILRQLPQLSWLLRGRAHLTPREFRNKNHKLLFVNALALLELLQPLIFQESQTDALNLCLEPFFDFLKNHCMESKKYQSTVNQFADFLVQYAQHNRAKAADIIFKNLETLRNLNDVYTNKKSSLKALVECFPKPAASSEGPVGGQISSFQEAIDSRGDSMKFMMVPPQTAGHSLTHEQVMPFLKKLESGQQREDILKVMQDLEETSNHSVDILKHFVPELCRIIQDPDPACCKLAHSLLLRHLKQAPSAVDDLLPSFIGCLESHDHSVVSTAITSIPVLVLLCKAQDAIFLLNKLFSLATCSSHNCSSELFKALDACTQHTHR